MSEFEVNTYTTLMPDLYLIYFYIARSYSTEWNGEKQFLSLGSYNSLHLHRYHIFAIVIIASASATAIIATSSFLALILVLLLLHGTIPHQCSGLFIVYPQHGRNPLRDIVENESWWRDSRQWIFWEKKMSKNAALHILLQKMAPMVNFLLFKLHLSNIERLKICGELPISHAPIENSLRVHIFYDIKNYTYRSWARPSMT